MAVSRIKIEINKAIYFFLLEYKIILFVNFNNTNPIFNTIYRPP